MSFKNKLMSKIPTTYILHKSSNKKEAKLIIKGYKAIRKNNLFDDDFYLNKYPKVKNSGMDPLLHYIFFGFDEGKKPNSYFDGLFYKYHYDDVNINPLVHYALYGINENRQIRVNNDNLTHFNNSNKINILFVLHEKIDTIGGTGFTNLDIINSLNNKFQAFILTSDGEDVELWKVDSTLEKIANFNYHPEKYEFSNSKLADIYEEILSKLDIKIVHINHLINHTFDLIEIANKKEIPYILSIHDFYYICPSIHLIDENFNFCEFKCENCKFGNSLKNWQKHGFKLLKNAYLNVVPSLSVMETYTSIYPDLNNFKLIEHGRNIKKSNIEPKLTKNPIKIVIPGHISQHKGSLLIKKIKDLDKTNSLELHFMGTSIPNLNKYGINHGRYERGDFNNIISKINPSFVAILSTCPETFSHTLTESWIAGIPVIATNLGALKERINKTGGGWLVDYKNPQKIYDTILGIDDEDYLKKIENISKIKFRSIEDMTDEYNKIYGEITDEL
ncbi:glycosyltransferase [uncultured Methanobrevibacter sp.]|uniref:glycosyltransferase n=1 Tax=uncultured Methanobrevibacter sp. TaxID=253161 RepID=UPI0026363FEE|nr:glycosyltransferase [uncultured Methanobrevibacter sp.]